jgi:hypothetical protein
VDPLIIPGSSKRVARFLTNRQAFEQLADRKITRLSKPVALGLIADVRVDNPKDDEAPLFFLASNDTVDRYNSTLAIQGWLLRNFRKCPTMPWCHNTEGLPVGGWDPDYTRVDSVGLHVAGYFKPREVYEMSWLVRQLYVWKYLRAVSVGFDPKKWEYVESREDGGGFGVNYLEQELLEVSPVPVPGNPEALEEDGSGLPVSASVENAYRPFLRAKVGGLDIGPLVRELERQMDGAPTCITLSHASADSLRKLLGAGTAHHSLPPATPTRGRTTPENKPMATPAAKFARIRLAKLELSKLTNEDAKIIEDICKRAGGTFTRDDGDGDDDHTDSIRESLREMRETLDAAHTMTAHTMEMAKTMGGHLGQLAAHVDTHGGHNEAHATNNRAAQKAISEIREAAASIHKDNAAPSEPAPAPIGGLQNSYEMQAGETKEQHEKRVKELLAKETEAQLKRGAELEQALTGKLGNKNSLPPGATRPS